MADEATINASLYIRIVDSNNNVKLEFQSRPTSFKASIAGTKGPTPGALTIPVGGKVVPLNELVTPGWCFMMNHDPTNYVMWGMRDPDNNRFYPVGELGPEKFVVFQFSRLVLEEYQGTGTGTKSGNQFFMKANTAAVVVTVAAFEA